MKKLLSFLLALSMLLAMAPMAVSAALVFPEDENIAGQDYAVDQVIFSQTGAPISPSSGSANKWNKFYPGKETSAATDPLDAANTVGRHLVGYNSGKPVALVKTVGIPTEGSFIWESNLMIAPPKEGDYPQEVTFKFLGNVYATFTRSTGTTYTYSIGSGKATGTIKAEEDWIRFTASVHCGAAGRDSADTTMHLSATLPDGTVLREVVTGTPAGSSIEYGMTMPQDSIGGIYLDDVYLYVPGDFGPTAITMPASTDDRGNYPLGGTITLSLYHRVDPTCVNPAGIKLYDESGKQVPITKVTWTAMRSDVILLDFTNHPLVANTSYTLVLPERTADLAGQHIMENEIHFRTNGADGDWREPVEVVRETPGGYVMPDPYNTGYRCDRSELADFFEKYPDFKAGSEHIITEEIARKYNYEFSHFVLTQGSIKITATSPIYIHDALMQDGGVANGRSGRAGESTRVTVAYCEITGGGDTFGGKNITVSHCYVHDVKADHMKGNTGLVVEHNYFRDGGTRNPGAHADVVQFMGSTTEVLNDMKFYGNRFDIPGLGYEHVANCAFFFKPEKNTKGFSNVQAIGNWFNGGGYTMYLTPAGGIYQLHYMTVRDNKIGCGHAFGKLNCNFDRETIDPEKLVYENNEYMETLQAGSIVYYDADGKRVYDIAEMSGSGSVLINLANYVAEAKQYRVDVRVVNADGYTAGTFTKDGAVRRYTPYKEYFTEDNQKVIGTFTDSAGTHNIVELINLPDLPSDVPETLMLSNLPLDMTDCRIEVTVTDTTHGETVIRTGALTDEVLENHRMPGVAYPEAATYAYREGFYQSDWAGRTVADILAEGVLAWDDARTDKVAVTADGVVTLAEMPRETLRFTLADTLMTGAARLQFDFAYDSEAQGELKLTIGGRAVVSIAPGGQMTIDKRESTLVSGTYTMELISLPYDKPGNLCTTADAEIAHNELYVRVSPAGMHLPTYGITEEVLSTYTHVEAFPVHAYLKDTGVAFGYEAGEAPVTLSQVSVTDLIAGEALYTVTVKANGSTETLHMPVSYTNRAYPLSDTAEVWIAESEVMEVVTASAYMVNGDITLYGATRSDTLRFAGATVSLGAEMTLNMKVKPETLPTETTALRVFADHTALCRQSAEEPDENGYHSIPLTGIRAAHMAWSMELHILAEANGSYYLTSQATDYSLLTYIENMYAKETTAAAVKTVLAAMLEYGASAEERLYDTEVVRMHATAMGISFTDTLPETYTSAAMTDADKATVNGIADVGAKLNEGIVMLFDLKDDSVNAIRVTCGTWSETYYAREGRVEVTGFHAASLLNDYTLTFLRADGTTVSTAHFVVGNFLAARMANAEETALARATVIYMTAAREYAISQSQS